MARLTRGEATSGSVGTGLGAVIGACAVALFKAPEKVQLEFVAFMRSFGPFAFLTMIMMFVALQIMSWAVRRMDERNEREVDRIASQRDELQKMFIEEWRSTRGGDR